MMESIARMKFSPDAGNIVSKSFRVVYSAINVAYFTTSGLVITNSLASIINQLSRYFLHFSAHSKIILKTAWKFIKNVQEDYMTSYKKYLTTETEHREFDNIISKMQSGNVRAKIIKELDHIDDKEDFIRSLIDMDKKHNFGEGDIKVDKGLINLLNEWYIHPRKLSQIEVDSLHDIMANTRKFKNGEIDLPIFKANLSKVCSKYRIPSEAMRADTVNRLAAHFGAPNLDNIEINGVKIFKDMQGYQIDRLNGVMENTAKNYKSEIIDIAMKFARKENCQNVIDFCNYLEYCVVYMNNLRKAYIKAFNDTDRRKREKIVGKIRPYFENKIYKEFMSDDTNINKMATYFHQSKNIVSQTNHEGKLNFYNDNAATYHFSKHVGDFKVNITPQDYLNIARDVASSQPESTMLSQEGNFSFIRFKNQDGVMVICIQPRPNGDLYIATCYRK